MNRTPLLGLGLALLIVAGAFYFAQRSGQASSATAPAPVATPATSTAPGAPASPAADRPVVQVWKSATCGCCSKWVEHMEAAGFVVQAEDVSDLASLKGQYGIPGPVRSCHTALVDGYLVEGHVPAEDIQRLLDERPQVAGLAVPGMPVGSPGMEVGDQKDPYDVLTFAGDGSTAVYSSH